MKNSVYNCIKFAAGILALLITVLIGACTPASAAEDVQDPHYFYFVASTVMLEGDEYTVMTGYDTVNFEYKLGKGDWKEIKDSLEEVEPGKFALEIRKGDKVSVRVKTSKNVLHANAEFGELCTDESGNAMTRVPMGFDHSAFQEALVSKKGYTCKIEEETDHILMLEVTPSANTVVNKKWFLDFSHYGKVSADGRSAEFTVNGKKVTVTILTGEKFKDGGVWLPDDPGAVVFKVDDNFDPNTMSVYIRDDDDSHTKFDMYYVGLYYAKGTGELSLSQSELSNLHLPNPIRFNIEPGKTKTYTPSGSLVKKKSKPAADAYTVILDGNDAVLTEVSPKGTTLKIPAELLIHGELRTVTTVGDYFLKGDTSVKKLIIPDTVTKIGKEAFSGVEKLATVEIKPNSGLKIGKNAFYGIKSKAKFKITASSKIYKKIKKKIGSAGVPGSVTYKRIKETADTPAVSPAIEGAVLAEAKLEKIDIDYMIYDIGKTKNWEGVTNISYLGERDGAMIFAVDFGDLVAIFESVGEEFSDPICITKEDPLYGGMAMDAEGNCYMVTGRDGDEQGGLAGMIVVTKYDPKGDIIGQVIDDGGSSLGFEAEPRFLNLKPFFNGNCVMAINDGLLAVYYARLMLSGHQSDSLLLVDTNTLEEVPVERVYQSHSFAQRALPAGSGFILASEGDCYDRAFVITRVSKKGEIVSTPIFRFGVTPGALDNSEIGALNNNFAQMGDIAMLDGSRVVMAATSARSMSEKAADEPEDIFIQIFDTKKDLSKSKAYTGGKKRTGFSGGNGDTPATDYGVNWVTSFKNGERADSLHCVVTENKTIVLLYEKYNERGYFEGVFYMLLDDRGNVKQNETCFWERARIPGGETPVCTGNTVRWIGNAEEDYCLNKYTLTVIG
ncbi:MAG: leucine-rich repeat protein [Lachnospiraceae bacterium]|nr:leucine-rich repeat protein [Lachnospiraceae bacterium]